jgi:G3E family GTPase
MKILIVSGFLGAGKTTFIKELIKRTGKEVVVLENEYGSTDIDEQVLSSQEDTNVWDLTEGCICCTKSADLNASIMTIESTLEPEYLIVEPSGVGALSNVIRNLQKIEYERITLLKPLTIVDAVNFSHDLQAFEDVYKDQIKVTGSIVISKPEQCPVESYEEIEKAVHAINPDAEILQQHYTKMPQEWWDSLLKTSYKGNVLEEVGEAELELESCTVRDGNVISPLELLWILEKALYGGYGNVVRAKGILKAGKEWIRYDLAGGRIAITGYEEANEKTKGECVFIGQGLDRIGLLMDLHAPGLKMRNRPMVKESKKIPIVSLKKSS